MQLEFTAEEVEVLRSVVENRLDGLLKQIGSADDRQFKDDLGARLEVLEEVHKKLGCERPEWSQDRSCEMSPAAESVGTD